MIHVGDCREVLRTLPARSVQTCITSPPYFGLRDYGTGEWEDGDQGCDHVAGMARQDTQRDTPGGRGGSFRGGEVQFRDACGKCGARRADRQIGLEPTPDEFVAAMVAVFRGVRRVLRDDGTVWLNLGDSYAATSTYNGTRTMHAEAGWKEAGRRPNAPTPVGCKPKNLLMIPAQVALALRADGWYLRSDIIWSKPNPMPESVTDRPTSAHEHLFLLSKGPRYFYDADAIREEPSASTLERWGGPRRVGIPSGQQFVGSPTDGRAGGSGENSCGVPAGGRNKRNVWTVATQPYSEAHFATFPPKLIEPCVLAGSPPKCCGMCGAPWRRVVERSVQAPDERPTNKPIRYQGHADADPCDSRGQDKFRHSTLGMVGSGTTTGWEPTCAHQDDTGRSVVLDPFAGAGTTGVVCGWHGREFVGIELNSAYAAMAERRIALEGRPGGKPNGHVPDGVIPGQLGFEVA